MFSSIVGPVVYVRACIYYEAYRVAGHPGKSGHFLATLLVAALDAPFLRFAADALFGRLALEDFLQHHVPAIADTAGGISGLASAAGIVLCLYLLEHLYYRHLDDGREIVRRFEHLSAEDLRRPHALALAYAFMMLVGGTAAVVAFH